MFILYNALLGYFYFTRADDAALEDFNLSKGGSTCFQGPWEDNITIQCQHTQTGKTPSFPATRRQILSSASKQLPHERHCLHPSPAPNKYHRLGPWGLIFLLTLLFWSSKETGKSVGENFKENQYHTTLHEKLAPGSRTVAKGNSTFKLLVISSSSTGLREIALDFSLRHEATAPHRTLEAERQAERNADSFPEVPSWEGNRELTTASWVWEWGNQALRRRTLTAQGPWRWEPLRREKHGGLKTPG